MIPTHVLGISAFYHDSAACLLRDGEIVAAAQEERFTRKKGDAAFPIHAVRYCLTAGPNTGRALAEFCFFHQTMVEILRAPASSPAVGPPRIAPIRQAGAPLFE